ncbi:hypothetical protein LSH36_355g01007 [Paralvinella palmiformis]|uniref:Transcription cofactor vestigial-like protein 2 n=1 Tax=Paralvinella palmiformis TaxID=53620 RepID=A0AAD9JFH9_9ANNE|nr:hypothetical protein LSH36_355g01007 [Paralvinella palmiformis]
MTCVDVMYQPYATYFPYHHHQRSTTAVHGSLDAIKFGVSKLQDPLDASPLTFQTGLSGSTVGNSLIQGHGSPPGSGAPGTGNSTPISHGGIQTKEETETDKGDTPHNTQYLSSNCVLVTYFSGDISANVDEHFSRALSQPSSYSTDSHGTKANSWKASRAHVTCQSKPSCGNSSDRKWAKRKPHRAGPFYGRVRS